MNRNLMHSPYTLQLIIHSCEALPIADITSSDPYVVIFVGGRLENRTKTIFRNRNPVWNQEFNLKILHRRSVISLEIFDEDRGKEDDQIGTVCIDLTDLSLDAPIRKKFSITACGGFDTHASKIDVTMTVKSNESVIQIVPDEPNNSTDVTDICSESSITSFDPVSSLLEIDTSPPIDVELNEIVESLVREHPSFCIQESVLNALTGYITHDRSRFFSKEMLQDLLWDASSLNHSEAEAAELLRNSSRAVYNRTQLRVINASRLVLSSKKCAWHPPIPPNSLQLNLLANDSKYITLHFSARLSMWACSRWLILLHDFWKGLIKSSELPSWAHSGVYSVQCTVQRSDGHRTSGAMVLALERPFELRVKNEFTPFKNLHNIIMSADSTKPKEYLMDIEVLSFGANGVEEDAHEEIKGESVHAEKAHLEKKKPTSPRKGLLGTVNHASHSFHKAVRRASVNVAHAGIGAVSGAADVAVGAAAGVAGSTLDVARLLVTGHSTEHFFQAPDDLRSTRATYTVAKFDHARMPASRGEHVYVDLNEDSFVERTLRRTQSDLGLSGDSQDHESYRKYPEMGRTDAEISFLLCQRHHSAQQGVLSHKRLTAQMLRQSENVVYTVPLNVQLEYKIELIQSRGLQLTPPGKTTTSAGSMYVKMKLVDRHGNSKPLGHLQEVKTASFSPTPDPDWQCNASFPAQDGFDHATYLRVEVCLDDFASHYSLGSCFIPLSLFRKKTQEFTFPMTPFKQLAVSMRDGSVTHALGETTFRIYRTEQEVNSPAVLAIRPRLIETNVFNTRWYCECLLAGTVNSEHSKEVEVFSLMPSTEGLELVPVGRTLGETAAEQVDVLTDSQSGPATPSTLFRELTRVAPVVAPEPAETTGMSTDWTSEEQLETYEIEVEVFENQRRQPYYPFQYTAEGKKRPAFSDLTYQVGYTFASLDAAAPPDNFTWSSEWCLDKKCIPTDPQGWTYGHSFGTLLAKYKQGKSRVESSAKMMARRRKWVRRAVCTGKGGGTAGNAISQFAKVNSLALDAVQIMDTSSHSEDEKEPLSPSLSPVSPAVTAWRNELLLHSPRAFLSVCQERLTPQSSVLIPWDQVRDAFVVSPSVLSIYVTVHRYMADSTPSTSSTPSTTFTTSKGCFRSAEVEIFVSNCPAVELKSMIEERKWFCSFKAQIRTLMQSGHVSGETDKIVEQLAPVMSEDGVPQTEELSLGSELVADLSENSIVLEARVQELDKYIGAYNVKMDNRTLKEKAIILRRDCRLRVYMAALFGLGLEGNHHYLESEVRAIMKRDFDLAQLIKHDTEVATANNRIEFYLDTAEMRIRDAVLCGWNYREQGQLQRTLEIFANGYFIEIVGLLGAFFEDNGKTAVKGLGSKVGLINTYLKHNDRLAIIINHALRPYALRAQPAATLSLFLDFDILVSWYTSVLLLEMRERAEHVLHVWKEPSKDTADEKSAYLYAVPWVPLHTEHKNTQFFTQIPEDLAEVLTTYLQHARVHKDTVAPSFQNSVGRLDGEVLMAYTSSFLHLSEQMNKAVDGKDWSASEQEDELAEYATFLASVANDAYRVEARQLYLPHQAINTATTEEKEEISGSEQDSTDHSEESAPKEAGIEKRTLMSYRRLGATALDHLCCIIFVYVFHERPHLLHDQLYTTWVETLPELEGNVEVEPVIPALIEDVTFFLQEKQPFLHPWCYCRLVSLAADKVVILYLSLLKMAHQAGTVFGPREVKQMHDDVTAMKDGLTNALQACPSECDYYQETATAITDHLTVLQACCELFEPDLSAQQFDDITKRMVNISGKNSADLGGMAKLLETCLGLKGVLRYTRGALVSRTGSPRASLATGSPFPDNHTTMPLGRPESVSLPTTPSSVTPTRRRTGLFGGIFFREPCAETADVAPASPPRGPSTGLPTQEEGALWAQQAMARADAETAVEAHRHEEEERELRMAHEVREQALVDCFALMIQDLRNHAAVSVTQTAPTVYNICTVNTPQTQLTSLSLRSPLERVFSTGCASEHTLEVQILHSARPPVINEQNRSASTRIGRLGGSFKRLFLSPKKDDKRDQ